jgi:hypothetical protein
MSSQTPPPVPASLSRPSHVYALIYASITEDVNRVGPGTPVLSATGPTVFGVTPSYMVAHRLLHEYKRAITDTRRNYPVCLSRRFTVTSDPNIHIGCHITLIPPQPNAPRTTVTLTMLEMEAIDDSVESDMPATSEAEGQRLEAQRDILDVKVDELGFPILPKGSRRRSAADGL